MQGLGFRVGGSGFRALDLVLRVSGFGVRFWGLGCGDLGNRKVDIRLPGQGNSNSHGARPVHQNHLDDQVDSDQ